MIKAVIFDIGNTLVEYKIPMNWSELYRPAFEHTAGQFGYHFTKEQYEHAGRVLTKYNTRVNPREYEISSEKIFAEIIDGMGLGSEELVRVRDGFYSYFQREAHIFDGVEETLKALSGRGVLLGTLSDVAYGMDNSYALSDIAPLLKYFACPYTSNDTGYRKPAPQGLLMIAEQLGVKPSEMVFVGDEEKDMRCAIRAGAFAVLINRDGARKDYGQGMEIKEFAELNEFLDRDRGVQQLEENGKSLTKKGGKAPFTDVKATGTGIIGWKAEEEGCKATIFLSRNKTYLPGEGEPALRFFAADGAQCSEPLPLNVGEDLQMDVLFCSPAEPEKQMWNISVIWCANPVLPGQFADPDIALFGDTYYLYATTDGFPGWSGTYFRVFSSKDLVNFTDEGVILDVAGDDVSWAVSSAWAPCIATKGGKYYFYFCAKDVFGDSHIGVAVADSPVGPFRAMQEPLLTKKMCEEHGIMMWQTIDPSVFTDEDGASYLLFGNGHAAVVRLMDDMVSLDLSTLTQYLGAEDFREAVTVTKRGGIYHFTWSCDDTGSADYHVNYGTAESIYGSIVCRGRLLSKDEENGILGTGHHCILSVPGDQYYIVYHRFYTPLGLFCEGFGFHREICIDKLCFDAETGRMLPVKPTQKGVAPRLQM